MNLKDIAKEARKFILPIVLIIIYFILSNIIFGYVCPSMIFVGLPCPACGLTRAGILLLTGNFLASFRMHPLFLPSFVYIVYVIILHVRHPSKLNSKYMTIINIALLSVVMALYVYRMVIMFPHTVPMVINENSIFHNVVDLLNILNIHN